MSRKPPEAVSRAGRFLAVRKELAAAAGLNHETVAGADKLRLEHACWVSLAIENLQSAILAGRRVEVGELERATAALNALLPAPQTDLTVRFVSETPPDLSRLTDAQLNMLEALLSLARGERPQKIERKHSGRWHHARQLVHVLDRAEARDGTLTDKERIAVANAVSRLLAPMEPIPYRLWNATTAPAAKPEEAAPPQPAPPPAPDAAAPPSPPVDNVVQLQKPLSL
jgi:hypothetical protein